jgi:hypothetical protein
MLTIIFLSVLLAVTIYLLFVPIILFIDTVNNNYYLQINGITKASILYDADAIIKITLKVFFLNFNFYPIKAQLSKGKKAKTKKKKNRRQKAKVFFQKRTILRIIRSFSVKKFAVDIDTGNCIQNAKLYPLFALLNLTKSNFRINFEGKNSLLLCVENRPIRLIRSFINI